MTRFYFDTFDNGYKLTDYEGLDFPSRSAARGAAASALADMARDALPNGQRRNFMIHIRDTGGKWFEGTLEYLGRDIRD